MDRSTRTHIWPYVLLKKKNSKKQEEERYLLYRKRQKKRKNVVGEMTIERKIIKESQLDEIKLRRCFVHN